MMIIEYDNVGFLKNNESMRVKFNFDIKDIGWYSFIIFWWIVIVLITKRIDENK